jgi:hypothetical protein
MTQPRPQIVEDRVRDVNPEWLHFHITLLDYSLAMAGSRTSK